MAASERPGGAPLIIDGDTVRALTEAGDKVGLRRFVETIFNVGSDFVTNWHCANLLRWAERWRAVNLRRKNEGRTQIPPAILLPALRSIMEEDSADMLDRWAFLLSNYEYANPKVQPKKVYGAVLAEMSYVEVKVLEFLCTDEATEFRASNPSFSCEIGKSAGVSIDGLAHYLDASRADVIICAHNLVRLNCLSAQENYTFLVVGAPKVLMPLSIFLVSERNYFEATELGLALVSACEKPHGRGS